MQNKRLTKVLSLILFFAVFAQIVFCATNFGAYAPGQDFSFFKVVQTQSTSEKAQITNVYFSKLPRSASQGVYAGEKIAVSWNTRGITQDQDLTIILYPLIDFKTKDVSRARYITYTARNSGEYSGTYEFTIPPGLLQTTEPDYKPYVATVMLNKDVYKDTAGFLYIKHLACPVLNFFDPEYENTSFGQRIEVIDPRDGVYAEFTPKIYPVVRDSSGARKPANQPIDYGGASVAKISLLNQKEFLIKTKAELSPSTDYYAYITARVKDQDNNFFDCVARRLFFTTPSNFFKNQAPRIENVKINGLSGNSLSNLKSGDKLSFSYNAYGIPMGAQLKAWISDTQELTPSGNFFQKQNISNSGSGSITIPEIKDKRVVLNIEYSYVGSGNVSGKAIGRSEIFLIGNTGDCPVLQIGEIRPGYYGMALDFYVSDWKNSKKIDVYINNRRKIDDPAEPKERNRVEYPDPETGRTNVIPDIGFDSAPALYQIDKIGNTKQTVYYPANSVKGFQEIKWKYEKGEKDLYIPGKLYEVELRFKADNLEKECIVGRSYYSSKDSSKLKPIDVSDDGYQVIENNSAEVFGKMNSIGYGPGVAGPYVEFAPTAQDINDETERVMIFASEFSNRALVSKVKENENFRILIQDDSFDFTKSGWVYRLCVRDFGDGFIDKAMAADAEIYNMKLQPITPKRSKWLEIGRKCYPIKEIKPLTSSLP